MGEYKRENGRNGKTVQGNLSRKVEITEPVRINKYLSEAGFCSRREADRMIESGKVTVDGIPAEMGTKVLPGQRVCVNGKPVRMEEEEILLVVNKPIGIVCTMELHIKHLSCVCGALYLRLSSI